MPKLIALSLRVLCIVLVAQVRHGYALDFADDHLHLNTYGTVGVARLDGPDVELFRTGSAEGPTLSHKPTLAYDTRLGVQLQADVTDKLEVVWQGLLQRDPDNENSLETKWAFIKYRPTPWMDIKLGRFMMPLYQNSDQMYVGYSQPWVRPPREVYGLLGKADTTNGLWVRLRLPTESFNSSLDASISRHAHSVPGARIIISPIIATALNVSKDDWAVRAMLARAPIATSGPVSQQLDALLNSPTASNHYGVTGEDNIWYLSLGFKYQTTDWYASGEFVRSYTNNNHSVDELQATTVTLGHYWGNWLPYVVYSKLDILNTEPETGLTGFSQAVAQKLIDSRKSDQSTFGVGARWDFYPGYALKAQVDWVNTPNGSRGLFNAEPSGQVRVYSFALEWAL